jgi:hypothetical protein
LPAYIQRFFPAVRKGGRIIGKGGKETYNLLRMAMRYL